MVKSSYDTVKMRIIAILSDRSTKDRLHSFRDISKKLGNKIKLSKQELNECLEELEVEGKIISNSRGLFRIFSKDLGLVQGRIVIDEEGNGYVNVGEEDENNSYKVATEDLNDALTGDIVLLKTIEGSSDGHPLARVEKIVKRNNGLVFCNVVKKNNCLVLEPEAKGFKHQILLKEKHFDSLVLGERLLIEIGNLVDNEYYYGSVSSHNVKQDNSKKEKDIDAKVLCEVETSLYINEHMDGIVNLPDGGMAVVDPKNLNDAASGDIVTVQVYDYKRNGRYVAEVLNIVKRKDTPVICDIKKGSNDEIELIPRGTPFKQRIVLDSRSTKKLLCEGDRIRVNLGEYDRDKKAIIAYFNSYVGNKKQTELEIRTICVENDIEPDFPEEAYQEADTLPKVVREEDKKGRTDLTETVIFSIDDETCKDRDDALSIRKLPNGNYELGIHISDVSYYIHPGMLLWEIAKQRSTSVYICNYVIPMLPKIISNGICSLDEGKERLTLSTFIELSPEGDIVNYRFEDAVIKSKKAMTYTAVNQILDEGIVPEGYEEFVEPLKMWKEVSDIQEKKKIERGYINFGNKDIKSVYDENNNVVEIGKRVCGSGQKLVENGMLLNGQCVGEYLSDVEAPFRVHAEPDPEKFQDAMDLLDRSGIKVIKVEEIIDGRNIEAVIKAIQDDDVRSVAANILLRSMRVAGYNSRPSYHFGLSLGFYTQFTSPIRRFMDLLAHYILRLKRDNKLTYEVYEQLSSDVTEMCKHSTDMEKNATAAERAGDKYDMGRYIDQKINEKFNAQVTYINSKGMYIKTREGIEGVIKDTDVEGLHLMYDKSTASYKDKKYGITIRIGDKLVATALGSEKNYRTINFGISEEDVDRIQTLKRKRA